MNTLFETTLPLPLYRRGKVRDTYDLGDRLLIVATDRISAFDVVLPCAVPCKGQVLSQLSTFWFSRTSDLIPNHVVTSIDSLSVLNKTLPQLSPFAEQVVGRSMVGKKAQLVPVECVVRGYLSGSAWAEYRERGTACGIQLARGLEESAELPQPIFTPTTKAETGHDVPLNRKGLVGLVGKRMADRLESDSIRIYQYARKYAAGKGIIIADTKMEFGTIDGRLILIDELLTPDSSRFWEASKYVLGRSQPSYDKQPVRDWLTESGWDKNPPAPALPPEVIRQTSERYCQAYSRLTGQDLT
ncbi:MAG: phosphoribosylaminoimidazolesuccinocarboxamide synthase [Chloroflexi bacterium]|nr:phosphoribosylaminoimidazolesuccinocarboxamide synthase [Chloroflexota bacterium]